MRRSATVGTLLAAAVLALAGCDRIGPGRSASGRTATTRLDAAGVTRLDVGSAFDAHVSLGRPESATITYDDNLRDLLDVGVADGTLRIRLKPSAAIRGRSTVTS